MTVCAVAFAVLAAADLLGLGLILAVIFLTGVASGFERPALVAFEAQVIPRDQAARGVSLSEQLQPGRIDPRPGARRDLGGGLRPGRHLCRDRGPARDLDRAASSSSRASRCRTRWRASPSCRGSWSASATSPRARPCSGRWRSTCSRSSSAARSPCCRSSRATSSTSVRPDWACCGPHRRSARCW